MDYFYQLSISSEEKESVGSCFQFAFYEGSLFIRCKLAVTANWQESFVITSMSLPLLLENCAFTHFLKIPD